MGATIGGGRGSYEGRGKNGGLLVLTPGCRSHLVRLSSSGERMPHIMSRLLLLYNEK